MIDLQRLRSEFIERFKAEPRFYAAPGRVNLIGEHTDYNDGFVMPAAIQFRTTVGIAPSADRRLRVRSTHFAETLEIALPAGEPLARASGRATHWSHYVVGVAQALQRHGAALCGADLIIQGQVPLGAGLSSSAALEVALAMSLAELSGHDLSPLSLAKLSQCAENDYVGARCGIMDPYAAIFGRAGHALIIDCRSLTHRLVPLRDHGDVRMVICNTMVRHGHAGGQYNRRREECERGVLALAEIVPGIQTLRDVSQETLRAHQGVLDPLLYRRCRHVVSENERVCKAAQALEAGNFTRFGELMGESHQSLRNDYEVSCDELDLMVRLAEEVDGVYGARMTGGGFGGCTVNLVKPSAVHDFMGQVAKRYTQASRRVPEMFVCDASDGAVALNV
jgi:galactokinase